MWCMSSTKAHQGEPLVGISVHHPCPCAPSAKGVSPQAQMALQRECRRENVRICNVELCVVVACDVVRAGMTRT